jgi:hypothetical protein
MLKRWLPLKNLKINCMNWMSVLGLCLIVFGTIFSFFGIYYSDKQSQQEFTNKVQEKNETIDSINSNNIKLINQNTYLLNSNADVSETNKNLMAQNNDILEKLKKYQQEIEERNKRIEFLKHQADNVKEYSYYATLDVYGRNFIPEDGIKFNSDLYNRMEKILTEVNGKTFVKNGNAVLPEIDAVIKKYPNFPFGYWAKYNLLKTKGDSNWRQFAKKAANIFEITTSIKGHNSMHDEALKAVKTDLATIHQ